MRFVTIGCIALSLLGGCVFNDVCVGGAVRNPSGRCVVSAVDDAGGGDGGGGVDGGTMDGAVDAGEIDGGPPLVIESFSVGVAHACAVDSVGTLRCWGANVLGQLASGNVAPFDAPRVIDLGAPVISAAGNTLTLCAQTNEPTVYCWGNNEAGQVGNGTADAAPVTTPFQHTALGAGRQIAGSFANMCFTRLLGTTVCWGRNDSGQLGIGSTSANQPMPGGSIMRTATSTLENVVGTTVADRHVCLRTNDAMLYCVGENNSGELGLGDTASRSFAEAVPGMTMVTSVSSSASHTCAVNGGDVYCWGDNDNGQAGSGLGIITVPTLVGGTTGATEVWTGDSASCALLDTREVVCWGSRAHGGIGDGMAVSADIVTTPVAVAGLSDVVAIDGSYFDLVCALTGSGELWCWGEDAASMVGGPPSGGTSAFLDLETVHTAPVRVDPLP